MVKRMDVHHHPRLPHGEKKHIKEYFLEFLMIFLAVTLGFFAEKIGENITESKREKMYVRNLVDDLQKDTTELQAALYRSKKRSLYLDTLMQYLETDLQNVQNRERIYHFSLDALLKGATSPLHHEASYTEIVNSGSLGLYAYNHVSDSIMVYQDLKILEATKAVTVDNNRRNAVEIAGEIMNFHDAESLANPGYLAKLSACNGCLRIYGNPEKINKFSNSLIAYKYALDDYAAFLPLQLDEAKKVIAFLQKEYDLP